ncbi:MAG: hypothetical protein ACHQAY_11220 [Hyphomicrobiales bacterium]
MGTGLKRTVGAGLAGLLLMGSITVASTPASAAWHRYGYHHYWHHGYYWGHRRYYGYGPGPAIVGGVIGALAAGALAAPYYYGPPRYYYYGPYYGPGPYYYGW